MGRFRIVTFSEKYRYYENNKNCGYCNVNMNKTTYAEVQNASLLSAPSIQMNKHTYAFLDHDHSRSAFSRAGHSVAVVVQKHFEIAKHGERKCSRRFNYLNYHTKKFLTICPSRVTWIIAPFLFRFLFCKHSHLAYPRVCCNTNEPALQQYSQKTQNKCAWVFLRKRGGRVVWRCRSKFSR